MSAASNGGIVKRWLPYPVLWVLLVALWLLLGRSLAAGDAILGGLIAYGAVRSFRALQAPQVRLSGARAAVELAWLVLVDIVRSNIAVGRIVLHRGTRNQTSGFVHIPLTLQNPVGLAVLACIITSTPGTSWARYDSASGVLVMHILDLVDEETWVRTIQNRYERRLLEIFL